MHAASATVGAHLCCSLPPSSGQKRYGAAKSSCKSHVAFMMQLCVMQWSKPRQWAISGRVKRPKADVESAVSQASAARLVRNRSWPTVDARLSRPDEQCVFCVSTVGRRRVCIQLRVVAMEAQDADAAGQDERRRKGVTLLLVLCLARAERRVLLPSNQAVLLSLAGL